jgi:hypothetical protein
MFYDPLSLSVLAPHGDPAPEARFREEFLTAPRKKTAAAQATDPQLVQRSRVIRAQVVARVGRYFV